MAQTENSSNTLSANKEGQPFIITRVVDAPRETVFAAYTEERHLKHWWGPKGFDLEITKFEPHPGGIHLYKMSAANGGFEMWGKWIFKEISAPHKLVFVVTFSDENGGVTAHPMSADWPLETLCTVTFEEEGGKTKLTCEAMPINSNEIGHKTFEEGFDSMRAGYGGTFDQLDEYLKK